MSYTVAVTFEIDADTQDHARELITRLLDQAFGEPEVLSLEASAPRWVPEKPESTKEPYTEWAQRLGLIPSRGEAA
jgi:hypothetical protein